ncbi:hypothetical protein [Streptomyces sp. NBC_00557]|uniref:hypothetical protein n=1 Tax=Streptomyces sp. NBC_00557 TaxID=2975776 RepID=UPI002E81140B|nr:hypothetical protein [Streptomyces sp. NBC_00557]WUC36414.1 C1 family peptidase [Streptomyces sp. NBC_00557]
MPQSSYITRVREYPLHPLCGRHLVLDRRSLNHTVTEIDPAKLKPAEWLPKVPILDQSNLDAQGIDVTQLLPGAPPAKELGSCTGNGATYALSALLDAPRLEEIGLSTSDSKAGEQFAIRWYSGGTHEDQWRDVAYPATDCGSSGLGVARYGKARGWFDGYRTATTALGVASALQSGGLLFGLPWHRAFFEPDHNGFIDVAGWERSPVDGGHEVYAAVLESVRLTSGGDLDLDRTVVALPNSWNTSWGIDGWFRMRLSTYQTLRREVDVYQFRLAA